jgi:hypothetical protein
MVTSNVNRHLVHWDSYGTHVFKVCLSQGAELEHSADS